MKLKGEPRADFGQVGPCAVGVELVTVMAEEDEVSLVVPGADSSLLELRVLRKQTGDHSAEARTQHSIKVVHYQLGRHHSSVVGAVVGDIFI